MAKNMKVSLTWYEMISASNTGILRKVTSLKRKSNTGLSKERNFKDWAYDVEGALAEQAAAKALNVYFDQSVDTFKACDIGSKYQVRWAAKMEHSLIIRDTDPADDIYILVVGQMGEYELVGWQFGFEAKKNEYVRNPHSWGEAYFIPVGRLQPMSDLPGLVD